MAGEQQSTESLTTERKPNKWLAFCVIALGTLSSTTNVSMINIANPVLQYEFGVTMEQVQWVTTVYLIIVCALMLLLGSLGDHVGGHRIYRLGLLVFAIGSSGCAFSSSFFLLLVWRVVQATGASMMLSSNMGLLATVFPFKQRGMAVGLGVMMVGVGNMLGPPVGGLILSVAPWPTLFLINVPLGLTGFILSFFWLRLPAPERKEGLSLDFAGAALLAVCIGSLILFITGSFEGSRWLGLVFAVSVPLLVVLERRHKDPLFNMALMARPRFLIGNLIAFFSYFSMSMLNFQFPFFLEMVWEIPVGNAGLVLMTMAFCLAVAGPLSGVLADRFGTMRIMPLALVVLSLSAILGLLIGAEINLALIVALLIVTGLGMGILNTPNISEIITAAGKGYSGYATGFIALNRNLAFCMGTATSASLFPMIKRLFEADLGSTSAHILGFRGILIAAFILYVVSLLFCILLRNKQKKTAPTPASQN